MKADELIGEKVLSKTGEEIGKVSAVHIDPKRMTFDGVDVNLGMFKSTYFFGAGYISTLGENGVILSIEPFTELKGKKVFDSTGAKIGKVKDVKREGTSNEIISLVVNRGLKEDLLIASNVIQDIGENVVLNQKAEA